MNAEQATQKLFSILDQLEEITDFCWELSNNPEQLKENLHTAICLIEKSIEEIDPDYFKPAALAIALSEIANE